MTLSSASTSGMAETYNENSDPQFAIIYLMVPYIKLGIQELETKSSSLTIVDFGSSHGRNSITAMKLFIQELINQNKLFVAPLIVHNDLPTNDWTKLFQLLAEDRSYQGVANGYSFYDRCLPDSSFTLGFTASSIHWLSKIPSPLKQHCFYTYGDDQERKAYKEQARLDFTAFIENRSKELVSGGVLVLSVPSYDEQGIDSISNYFDQLYITAQSFFNANELARLIIPIYLRSLDECTDTDLFNRCSFKLIKAEVTRLNVPGLDHYHNGQVSLNVLIHGFAKVFQSTMEPLIKRIFKLNDRTDSEVEALSQDFWMVYEQKLMERADLVINPNQYVCACLVLQKL